MKRLTLADGKGTRWEGLNPRLLHNIDLREYFEGAEMPFRHAVGCKAMYD
jgi:hypothetical protein